jgi:hypothetical protein
MVSGSSLVDLGGYFNRVTARLEVRSVNFPWTLRVFVPFIGDGSIEADETTRSTGLVTAPISAPPFQPHRKINAAPVLKATGTGP